MTPTPNKSEPGPAGKGPRKPWHLFCGSGAPHGQIDAFLERHPAPPWRSFTRREAPSVRPVPPGKERRRRIWTDQELELVNAALYLRRPLLVEGDPGTGKSMMAKDLAYELSLGPHLTWSINSRTTLQDGLYGYDALGRLQEANLAARVDHPAPGIEEFLSLGPLGTALTPHARPRVLLIDEFDKCDVDLPNDLLAVLEEGEFRIPELARAQTRRAEGSAAPLRVRAADVTGDDDRVEVSEGWVRCTHFPIIVLTSNGERQFPAQFMRRCLRLEIQLTQDFELLRNIVLANFGQAAGEVDALAREFLRRREADKDAVLALDQLLNAVYLAGQGAEADDLNAVLDHLMRDLAG